MTQSFSIKEAFGFSLKMFRIHFGLLMSIFLLMYANIVITRFIIPYLLKSEGLIFTAKAFTPENIDRITRFLNLISGFIAFILVIGLNRIGLDLYDTGKSRFGRMFGYFPYFRILFATLIYISIIVGGLILFIIPGFIWLVKYIFFDLCIIDKNYGATESIKKSGQITMGHKWKVFAYFLLGSVMYLCLFFIWVNLFTVFAYLIVKIIGMGKAVALDFLTPSMLLIFDGFETLLYMVLILARVYIYRKLLESAAAHSRLGETSEKIEQPTEQIQ